MTEISHYYFFYFFQIYPYVALITFFAVSLIRYEGDPYSWKSSSSQILEKRLLFIGSLSFHVGIILLLLGHFVGLLTPEFIYRHLISAANKQYLAMTAGGIFAIFVLFGLLVLLYRRIAVERVRKTSRFSDYLILVLLLAQVILGLWTIQYSLHYPSGISMERLALWAQSIIVGRFDAYKYVVEEPWIFQVHIILGLTILWVFPFTRLVHIWTMPINYLWRKGYQIVRTFKK